MFLDQFLVKSLFVVLFSFLVGCGGSSESNDDSGVSSITDTVNSLDDIVGFWDATIEVDGETDEIFFLISDSGLVSVFDYLGDSFDGIADCYVIADDALVFTHLTGNSFLSEALLDGSTIDLSAFFEGGNLILRDSFGDETLLSPTSLSIDTVRSMDCVDTLFAKTFEIQKQSVETAKSKMTILGRF